MAAAAQFRVEHLAQKPAGYHVRTVKRGSHEVRIGFPPGRRKKGSGKVLEILHPKTEKNAGCIVSQRARTNPTELLIFGNPSTGTAAKRAARERAARIRSARLNPDLFDAIRHGSRVTFVDRFGKHRTGRAVMRSTFGGWVLNMGGPHGTPKVVNRDMVIRVKNGNPSAHDVAWQHQKKVAAMLKKMPKPIRGVFDPPKPKRANRGRRRRDRNPDEGEAAVQLFETFHGKDASKIVEKHVSTMIRKDYTTLGDLMYLIVKTPIGEKVTFNFEDDHVKLASSANGQQLYCIGGSQNLLPLLDADSQRKDFIDLGECLEVAYLARKIHSNYEPIEWYHKFGERAGSSKPQLMFDKLKKQIFFIGGEYFIDPKVDLSPGIEN